MKKTTWTISSLSVMVLVLLFMTQASCEKEVVYVDKFLQADSTVTPPCAATLEEGSGRVWPAPPQQARVSYVGTLQDNQYCDSVSDSAKMRISYPRAVAANSKGIVYVSHRYGLVAFNPKTAEINKIAEGVVINPTGITVDKNDNLYVIENATKKILVFGSNNKLLKEFGTNDGLLNPQGIAINDASGQIYVSDGKANLVHMFDLTGNKIGEIKSTVEAPLPFPVQMAINSKGNLYVVNQGDYKVNIYSADGSYISHFGSFGKNPGQFIRPKGIAIDSEDNVWVSDSAFDNIQIFNEIGQIRMYIGEAGTDEGQFNLPSQLYMDSNDRLYVSEYVNNRIQVFQFLGGN